MGKMIYDDGGRPFSALDAFNVAVCRPTAFVGGTSNARGDKDGTDAAHTLFTVTGDVLVRMWGVCTVDVASTTGTLEVGITGNTALLIAQTTASGIDVNEIWNDATPAIGDTLANITGPFIIPNGLDIIETCATADITAGNIYYICLWRPLSMVSNSAGESLKGNVVAAGNQI